MKKIIFSLLLLTVFSAFSQRVIVGENNEKGLIPDSSFTPFQLGVGFIDNAQLFDGSADSVVSFGLIGVGQKSAVLSCCPVINLLQNNYFLQSSGLIAGCDTNWGISLAAIFNISQKKLWRTNRACQCNYGPLWIADWRCQCKKQSPDRSV